MDEPPPPPPPPPPPEKSDEEIEAEETAKRKAKEEADDGELILVEGAEPGIDRGSKATAEVDPLAPPDPNRWKDSQHWIIDRAQERFLKKVGIPGHSGFLVVGNVLSSFRRPHLFELACLGEWASSTRRSTRIRPKQGAWPSCGTRGA
jgi:hypothetical protein